MDVKKLKDYEKDVRTKINNEFETLRAKNDNLSRVLMAGECEMWRKIRYEDSLDSLDLLIFTRNLMK